jgi:DNA-binding NtrC family response regulator
MEKDSFRRDLYFRLGVVKVQVPSLNERREDVVPIAKHYLLEFSNKFGKIFTGISPDAEVALKAYNWTGHVRELKNLMERAVLISEGPELTTQALGVGGVNGSETGRQTKEKLAFPALTETGIDLATAQESLEKYYIEQALRLAQGNESKAAALLRMNHHTFRYRKKRLLIE